MQFNANKNTTDKIQNEIHKHRNFIDENKHQMILNQDLINKIASKLERTRDSLQSEITMTREELQNKMDTMDKIYMDQMTSIETMIKADKTDVKGDIQKTADQFKKQLGNDIEELKTYVMLNTNKVKEDRVTLQEKYNEKLAKIKDVCAQYFSKYEKHLLH